MLIILVLLTLGIVMSLLLSKYAKKKWIGYVPSFIGVVIIVYYSLRIHFEKMDGIEELGYQVFLLMVMVVMAGNLMTNIAIHFKKRSGKSTQ